MAKSERTRFLTYLRTTIIPDTLASDPSSGIAADLKKCARLIAAKKTDGKFTRFLTDTLIPDLEDGGRDGYVEDFQQCVSYIKPKRARK